MNRRFLYFINPISGTKNKALLLDFIKNKTSEKEVPFEIAHTNKEGDYAYLKEKIEKENITDIIICGGDGTVNQIASHLIGINVNVGIIPMGSGNGLALAANIPKDYKKAFEIILNGTAKNIDAFYINDCFSCMLSGLGFDATIAHDFSKQKKRGLLTYIKLSTRNYFFAKAYSFEISIGNKTLQTEALFISIANSNQFGNQVTIAPRAQLNDGLLDIVVVGKQNKIVTAIALLLQILKGKIQPSGSLNSQKKGIYYFHAEALTILNPQLAPLHIDGEPAATADRFDIKIIPSAMKLLQPA
jgi:YegS/Rv2252/BmrU family lipid kinase